MSKRPCAGSAVLASEAHADEPNAANALLSLVEDPEASPQDILALVSACGVGILVQRDSAGDTALHIAAQRASLEACRCLLDAGADPTARNNKGRTPAAQLGVDPGMASLLTEAAQAWQACREAARAALWNAKMQATQTQSAYGIRTL